MRETTTVKFTGKIDRRSPLNEGQVGDVFMRENFLARVVYARHRRDYVNFTVHFIASQNQFNAIEKRMMIFVRRKGIPVAIGRGCTLLHT